ncbi:hypothetical protein Tco_0878880 [Tanacetum coccineum]|uniref:Uncharacterized protein n=1 Tax=Tanacetum coccineum TaxID=301880 RepID=A0ABQ5C4I9_9ASTR
MSFWPDYSKMPKVLPPKPKKMLGKPRKKRIRAAHETKYPNKISRPRKNPIPSESVDDQTEPLVPLSILVEEHLGSSQYEVGGSSSTVNASKTKKKITFSENVGRLGSWFGIGENESDPFKNIQEETMHDSEIQESQTVQTAPTQSSQTAGSDGIAVDNQVVPVNEPVPRAKRNFVIPRQRERSERILRRKLLKDHPGTGSSKK